MMDVNCDLGEGYGNDSQIMLLITSCSIACGGHYGNVNTIEKSISLAAQNNVKIGAHPSYPDLDGFGRNTMNIFNQNVHDSFRKQLDIFFNIASRLNVAVHHIKPHGALYNDVYSNQEYWEVFKNISCTYPFDKYYVLANCLKKISFEKDVDFWQEGFADRNYHTDNSLLSRALKGALIQDLELFKAHVDLIIMESKIKSVAGTLTTVNFDTLCVHGDHPYTLDFLNYIKLLNNG